MIDLVRDADGCGSDADLRAVRAVHLTEKSGPMNNWIKTWTVTVAILLLGSSALPQSDCERLGMSANELARKVVTNELKFPS